MVIHSKPPRTSYLFCPNYQDECTNKIIHVEDKYLDIHTLLLGDQSLGSRVNETIFENVQEYIRQTRRFCTWAIVILWCNISALNIGKYIQFCPSYVSKVLPYCCCHHPLAMSTVGKALSHPPPSLSFSPSLSLSPIKKNPALLRVIWKYFFSGCKCNNLSSCYFIVTLIYAHHRSSCCFQNVYL